MFSNPQNHLKSTPRPNFDIIPTPFDIKNMPKLTPPSELPESPQIRFEFAKKSKI